MPGSASPAPDLFALAHDNDPRLRVSFDDRVVCCPDERATRILRLAEVVSDLGRVSVNLAPEHCLSFLEGRGHLNIFEVATLVASRDQRDVDEVLRELLRTESKDWYPLRMGFDGAMQDGRRFHYGALNIGGMGAPRYGLCCMVTGGTFHATRRLAYVRGDSLKCFVDEDGALDQAALARSCATHGGRHHLAALKHADHCPDLVEGDWPGLLCNDQDYVEAIFVDGLELSDLAELRFRRSRHDELNALSDRVLLGEQVEAADRLRVERYDAIQERLRALGVSLKLVPDA